jgi:hypothetical protein
MAGSAESATAYNGLTKAPVTQSSTFHDSRPIEESNLGYEQAL